MFYIPLFLISQDLNDAYLESLPEDVREDVSQENERSRRRCTAI